MTEKSGMSQSASSLKVGDRVYLTLSDGSRHPGKVRRVYRSGKVDLEWIGPLPHPFFTGAYSPEDLSQTRPAVTQ